MTGGIEDYAQVFTETDVTVGTGAVDRIPPFDPRSGAHLWCTVACWRVVPEKLLAGEPAHLDSENLLYIGGLGCYYCEFEYNDTTKHRRCKGQP